MKKTLALLSVILLSLIIAGCGGYCDCCQPGFYRDGTIAAADGAFGEEPLYDETSDEEAIYGSVEESLYENEPAAPWYDSFSNLVLVGDMEHSPLSFSGTVYVIGIVTTHDRFPFALMTEENEFILGIDYRGNQAIPAMGSVVVVSGRVGFRGCCGYFLVSTQYYVDDAA